MPSTGDDEADDEEQEEEASGDEVESDEEEEKTSLKIKVKEPPVYDGKDRGEGAQTFLRALKAYLRAEHNIR